MSKVKRFKKKMKSDGYGEFPPIQIAIVGGKKIVIDGHHRRQGAIDARITEVPVEINEVTTKQAEALLLDVIEAMN
jgi:filamentous hemagglutinin|tara:strand:+ start:955 stop:1182 length:228 start_codon:yes stop_codon:yes gene_type:complete